MTEHVLMWSGYPVESVLEYRALHADLYAWILLSRRGMPYGARTYLVPVSSLEARLVEAVTPM